MLPVPDVVRAHHDARMHSLEKTDVIFKAPHHSFFARAIGVTGRTENGNLNRIPFFHTESFSSLGMHENRVGVNDLRGIFPMTGAALGVNVPLEGRENVAVLGKINVLGNLMIGPDGAGIAIAERKAD